MHINELKENHKLLDIFCNLVQIPSPSLSEEKVIEWIGNLLDENKISYKLDDYKNVVITISGNNPEKQPLLLSAHMDVVGDFAPVNINVKDNFIETDKTRTLGADNKAGVACGLLLAIELANDKSIDHGGLEIVFTRDEEHGMSGIKHLDFSALKSKYAIVMDADKLGQLLVSGASYTNAVLTVNTTYGGHSGLDIQDKNRLNAVKLIADLTSKIPQGVYFEDETGTITSINLGTLIGGNIQNTVSKILSDKIELPNYLDYFIDNAVTNVINTTAKASYSIRSASVEKEIELKEIISSEINKFNAEYGDLAKADVVFSEHLPPFEKANDTLIEEIHTSVCQKLNIKQNISSFHAGAETHIYSQNVNANGEKIRPFLVGMADIFNMHSKDEMVDYKTLLQGYEILKGLFIEFNK